MSSAPVDRKVTITTIISQHRVVVHIYGRNFALPADIWAERLNNRINDAVDNDDGYVVRYPDQDDVIAFNFSTSNYFTNLIQPFQLTSDDIDLTTLAVFIGSYGCEHDDITCHSIATV